MMHGWPECLDSLETPPSTCHLRNTSSQLFLQVFSEAFAGHTLEAFLSHVCQENCVQATLGRTIFMVLDLPCCEPLVLLEQRLNMAP